MTEPEVELWRAAGLYDPAAPGAADRLALLRFLADDGATMQEMTAAAARGRLFALAGDRRIHPESDRYRVAEAAERAGLSEEEVRTVSAVLGLHLPPEGVAVLTPAEVSALATFGDLCAMVGADAALGIMRVLGAAAARVAEAAATTMRMQIDAISLDRTGSELRTAVAYRDVAALVPRIGQLLDIVHRRHIEEARRHLEQLVNDERGLLCGIGFADLCGFTALAETLSVDELSKLLSAVEATASAVVFDGGGRVVKFIGDAVMYSAPTPDVALELAVALVEHPVRTGAGVQVRAAVAWGPVLAQDGDYFGSTVNLAARLLSVARPRQVVAGPGLGELLDPARWSSQPMSPVRLRGFDDPVVPLLVRPRDERPEPAGEPG